MSKKYSIDQNLIASKFDIAEYKSIKKIPNGEIKFFMIYMKKLLQVKRNSLKISNHFIKNSLINL